MGLLDFLTRAPEGPAPRGLLDLFRNVGVLPTIDPTSPALQWAQRTYEQGGWPLEEDWRYYMPPEITRRVDEIGSLVGSLIGNTGPAGTVADFTPGLGEIRSADQAWSSAQQAQDAWNRGDVGDWLGAQGGMLLGAVGALPAAGPVVRAASKAGDAVGDLARALTDQPSPALYRATDSTYASSGPGAFQWWTPDPDWAATYGSNIVSRGDEGLNILDLPLDGPDVQRALENAGIDTGGIRFSMWAGDDELPLEVQQILADPSSGPLLAERLRVAGYNGVRHPDHVAGQGIGEAVALLTGGAPVGYGFFAEPEQGP